ncbi:MAG: hypothetical protein AAF196_19575 [Planctomycetota bacterium]
MTNDRAQALEENFDTGDPRSEFTPALLGFYATSTGVGVFAAIAAVAFVVLPEFEAAADAADAIGWVFSVLTVVTGVAAWILLKRVRQQAPDDTLGSGPQS